MLRTKLTRPAVVMLLGLPGSGKTYTSSHLADLLGLALVSDGKIREGLFEKPTFSKHENMVVLQMMVMMAEEYLTLGIPVMFDTGINKAAERKTLREIARKHKADTLLIWLQIDQDTARLRARSMKKDTKTLSDIKKVMSNEAFDEAINNFQAPHNEDYIVISGKHTFESQKPIIMRRLRELGLINDDMLKPHVPMPEMVNLAAQAKINAGRVDYNRRNISIG